MHTVAREKRRGSTRALGAIFAVGLLITIGAILFGRFDEGQIDVSAVITQSNDEHIEAGETSEVIPVSNNPNRGLPNGGLVGTGNSTPPPPPPETETGTSTEDEAEGEGDSNTETETEVSEGEGGEDAAQTEETAPESTETAPAPVEGSQGG